MTETMQRIACRWCRAQTPADALSCDRCGAPLDARDKVTDSGWREAPRLRNLTEIHFGASTVQVDGAVVPVAEMTLDPSDTVFFEHHAMLWKDHTVPMAVMSSPGGMQRLLGDMPFVLSVARGPGRLAFSRDAAGSLVVLPVDPGMEIDVRGHAMLAASGTLSYAFVKVPGLRTALMGGTGMYQDQFTATAPGVLILHGYGTVFERTLAAGESLQLEPGGFLYKDASVTLESVNVDIAAAPDASKTAQGMQTAKQFAGKGFRGLKAMRELMSDGVAGAAGQLLSGGGAALGNVFSSNSRLVMTRLTGPGRVGMQSMYQHRVTD
ncbi:MAG: AIM24 family protein [Actinobacteria bacterium]|nr:AIM24 family protein [Actinomycetota bacterium]